MSFKSEDYCSTWQMLDVKKKQPPCVNTECVVPAAVSIERCRTVHLAFFPLKVSHWCRRIQLHCNTNNMFSHQLHLNPNQIRFYVYFLQVELKWNVWLQFVPCSLWPSRWRISKTDQWTSRCRCSKCQEGGKIYESDTQKELQCY